MGRLTTVVIVSVFSCLSVSAAVRYRGLWLLPSSLFFASSLGLFFFLFDSFLLPALRHQLNLRRETEKSGMLWMRFYRRLMAFVNGYILHAHGMANFISSSFLFLLRSAHIGCSDKFRMKRVFFRRKKTISHSLLALE